jgi:hypothetical protein
LLFLDAVGEEQLERRDRRVLPPLAEMTYTSKDLAEIDPLPDTQEETLTYTCCSESERQAKQQRKDRPMNPHMQTQAQAERSTSSDIAVNETDLLAGWGFDPHEIASLRLPAAVVPDRRE